MKNWKNHVKFNTQIMEPIIPIGRRPAYKPSTLHIRQIRAALVKFYSAEMPEAKKQEIAARVIRQIVHLFPGLSQKQARS
jgi:hypothetical protein